MEVHPAINCEDEKCFSNKISEIRPLIKDKSFAHIDISDGIYTDAKSFWSKDILNRYSEDVFFEAHLMIKKESIYSNDWFDGTFKRVLIQGDVIDDWGRILDIGEKSGTEIGAVVVFDNPNIDIPNEIKIIEILSVKPGFSGQKFHFESIDLIKNFKKKRPDVKIMVDGGINFETGKICADAGVDVLVSSSFIWSSDNPEYTFKKLLSIKI